MDKKSVAKYKIVKDGQWYIVFEYNMKLSTWLCQAVALTYFGAMYQVKKLIKEKNRIEIDIAYLDEDGKRID